MLRKLAFWVAATPFIFVLIAGIGLVSVALSAIYFLGDLLIVPEAEWSA
jgi:hypothetical protein